MTQIINILDEAVKEQLNKLSGICEDLENFGFETMIVLEDNRPPLLQIRGLKTQGEEYPKWLT